MPINRKKQKQKKYLIWAIVIVLAIGMIVSFSNHPVFTEVVLYP